MFRVVNKRILMSFEENISEIFLPEVQCTFLILYIVPHTDTVNVLIVSC